MFSACVAVVAEDAEDGGGEGGAGMSLLLVRIFMNSLGLRKGKWWGRRRGVV